MVLQNSLLDDGCHNDIKHVGVKYSVHKYDARHVRGNSVTVNITARYGNGTLLNIFCNRGHPVVFEF
jgi:hypothetical protein